MKTSDLIKKLEQLNTVYGDLEVYFPQSDSEELEIEIDGVAVCFDEDEKPVLFLISDRETLDAFVES